MAAPNKFDSFITAVCAGTHAAAINDSVDILSCYLTNAIPSASGHVNKADLEEIAIENGYDGPQDTQNSSSQTGGVISITGSSIMITATSGSIGPFQRLVLFNSSVVGGPLWAWWDHGFPITLDEGESFAVNFSSGVAIFS